MAQKLTELPRFSEGLHLGNLTVKPLQNEHFLNSELMCRVPQSLCYLKADNFASLPMRNS